MARRAGFRASHIALVVALVVALVCGRESRVCRRVSNRPRVGLLRWSVLHFGLILMSEIILH